jgi:hypothetical protein
MDEPIYYCGVQTQPVRYVDPAPAEFCEAVVENEGDVCPLHDDGDDRDEYEEWRERQMDARYGD